VADRLVISGFHRSGTSATAQILHRAGLFLGYELLEALPSNPYGHFEDREVVEFHQKVLADNGLTWLVDGPLLPLVGEERWAGMRRMIEKRDAEHALWGFKDPRMCMFMMPWKYLMPDMKVLLVYRHFSECTYSLGRRHSSDLFLNRGNRYVHRRFFEEPDLALRMWLAHNEALVTFARAYPEDTLTVSLDAIREGFPLVQAVNERWNLGLADVPTAEVYDPSVSSRRTRRQPVSDRRLIPRVTETWEALERLAVPDAGNVPEKEPAFA
jgi:hypothetical protein